jgi:hypothetical protein
MTFITWPAFTGSLETNFHSYLFCSSKWEFSRIHKLPDQNAKKRKNKRWDSHSIKTVLNTQSRSVGATWSAFLVLAELRWYLYSFRRVAVLGLPVISHSKWKSVLFGWWSNPVEGYTGFLNWLPYAYLSVYPACPKMLWDKWLEWGFSLTTQWAGVSLAKRL